MTIEDCTCAALVVYNAWAFDIHWGTLVDNNLQTLNIVWATLVDNNQMTRLAPVSSNYFFIIILFDNPPKISWLYRLVTNDQTL